MKKPNKSEFITAYVYAYKSTKKEAEKAYKTASPAYISAIIDSIRSDAKKAFYND